MTSLPLWERGLKSLYADKDKGGSPVAPFVGAWVEIVVLSSTSRGTITSLLQARVAPFVGAWVEILSPAGRSWPQNGRSLCGSVG